MASVKITTGTRIIDPMIALAGCSTQHSILIAGSKSMEMTMELQRRGYLRAAATGNCGHPAGQYDVALADWRRRPLRTLEAALDWLANFLSPTGTLVVWDDAQKPAVNQSLRALLEARGFAVVQSIVHECGSALSARREQTYPLQKAA
jgi:hypothetical protein